MDSALLEVTLSVGGDRWHSVSLLCGFVSSTLNTRYIVRVRECVSHNEGTQQQSVSGSSEVATVSPGFTFSSPKHTPLGRPFYHIDFAAWPCFYVPHPRLFMR